jgi:hypothetical protein
MQPPGLDPMPDRMVAESEVEQLPPAHHRMLARRQLRDAPVR